MADEPLETAWSVLKAPLDMSSIQDMGVDESGRFPERRFVAEFIDPETQERLPVDARMGTTGLGAARIRGPPEEEVGGGEIETRAEHLIHPTSLSIDRDHIDDPRGIYPYSIKTEPGYEGRGYQEALVQLILQMAEAENRKMYQPPLHMMSEQGLGFMRRLRDKYANDDPVGRPNP